MSNASVVRKELKVLELLAQDVGPAELACILRRRCWMFGIDLNQTSAAILVSTL